MLILCVCECVCGPYKCQRSDFASFCHFTLGDIISSRGGGEGQLWQALLAKWNNMLVYKMAGGSNRQWLNHCAVKRSPTLELDVSHLRIVPLSHGPTNPG